MKPNPVTSQWFLFRSGYWQILSIIGLYLLFTLKIGPQLMSNRKPFELRRTILIYNIIMVIINVYFFIESVIAYEYGSALFDFDYPSNDSPSHDIADSAVKRHALIADQRRIAFVYWYLLSKLIDLADTVFFVLRKKWSNVSALHVYHHASVPLCVWLAVYYTPTSGVNGIVPMLNSIVHVLMYTYYALSAFGPRVRQYLWWKRYITTVQMLQFVIMIFYGLAFITMQKGWPPLLIAAQMAQPPIYLVLFALFYVKTYNTSSDRIKIPTN